MTVPIFRKLIVDEDNELFDARGMKYLELSSDFNRIREYAANILETAPLAFLEGNLLEQQLSEIIKNGIKHGNKNDPAKKLRVWYDLRHRARFIVEDEGAGFVGLDDWNKFYKRRQTALFHRDFAAFLDMASYRGPHSDENDGGNSLIAALEYWNGGMIFNGRKNKVGVIKWFTGGSVRGASE